jgi:hypothetical protein
MLVFLEGLASKRIPSRRDKLDWAWASDQEGQVNQFQTAEGRKPSEPANRSLYPASSDARSTRQQSAHPGSAKRNSSPARTRLNDAYTNCQPAARRVMQPERDLRASLFLPPESLAGRGNMVAHLPSIHLPSILCLMRGSKQYSLSARGAPGIITRTERFKRHFHVSSR